MPDSLKALLVDDWENVTKNKQVVPLPAKYPVNTILDMYGAEERQKRHDAPEIDLLDEVIAGMKEYFEKSIGRILLYRFEREQYHVLRKSWESGTGDLANKTPGDIYGAEHLTRLFCELFSPHSSLLLFPPLAGRVLLLPTPLPHPTQFTH